MLQGEKKNAEGSDVKRMSEGQAEAVRRVVKEEEEEDDPHHGILHLNGGGGGEEEDDEEDVEDEVVGMKVTEGKTDTTIVTQKPASPACSDLTDNNNDGDDQAPKTFPQKLLDILTNEEHTQIINWLPEGNGFIISKKKAFAEKILPKYFKASKFTSFTRKLNRWGFSRIPRGPQTGSYFHKFFRRDKPDLCMQMTSNSGNKFSNHGAMPHQLLPNMPGGMPGGVPVGIMGAPSPYAMMPGNPAATGAMGMGAPMMPGVVGAPGVAPMAMAMPGMPPMMPFMPPPQMMANMTPQQQQAMFQQSMFQFQHMMMQQQQQQMQMMSAAGVAPPNPMAMPPHQQQSQHPQQQQQTQHMMALQQQPQQPFPHMQQHPQHIPLPIPQMGSPMGIPSMPLPTPPQPPPPYQPQQPHAQQPIAPQPPQQQQPQQQTQIATTPDIKTNEPNPITAMPSESFHPNPLQPSVPMSQLQPQQQQQPPLGAHHHQQSMPPLPNPLGDGMMGMMNHPPQQPAHLPPQQPHAPPQQQHGADVMAGMNVGGGVESVPGGMMNLMNPAEQQQQQHAGASTSAAAAAAPAGNPSSAIYPAVAQLGGAAAPLPPPNAQLQHSDPPPPPQPQDG